MNSPVTTPTIKKTSHETDTSPCPQCGELHQTGNVSARIGNKRVMHRPSRTYQASFHRSGS